MSDDLFDVFNEDAPATADSGNASALPATPHPLVAVNTGAHSSLLPPSAAVREIVLDEGDVDSLRSPASLSSPPSSRRSFPLSAAPSTTAAAATAATAVAVPVVQRAQRPQAAPTTTATTTKNTGNAVVIIHSTPSALRSDSTAEASSASRAAPPAGAVFTEPNSRLRVRRATAAFEQLDVRLAEFPFVSFAQFRQAACRNGGQSPVTQTCIGVVTRKSDPKQNAGQTRGSPYAVLTLWSMESISPSPETEMSLLLCGAAFDLLYSHLVRGSVIALSNVAMCTRKGGGGGGSSSAEQDVLLRVSDHMSVRQLGFSADLGTCASLSHKSNERCHAAVNTRLGQHCNFHVGDLRKAVRGTTNMTAAAAQGSRAATNCVMKGGALTTHMTLTPTSGTTQLRTPLMAGSGAPTPLQRTASARVLNSHQQQQLQQQQQLLRQPSFLAVRGGTGLPVEDAAARRGMLSAGSGVYGGVQSRAPLPLTQQAGLRPSSQYPSAQSLGVSSRGRDVLEAARQQAVEVEEAQLLRRSLRPGALHGPAPSASSSATVGRATLNTAAAAAAGRLRERDATTEEAIGAGRRSRTEPVPTSSSAAIAAAAAAAPSPVPTTSVDARRVEALRAQFQPLHRGGPAAFSPLTGTQSSVHSIIPSAVQRDYRHTVVGTESSSGHGGQRAQAALLRAAAKAAKDVTAQAPRDGTPRAGQPSTSEEAASPLTLLGTVASRVSSEHDHLRGEAEWQRLVSFVDSQITKEKALEALEAVTQQEIKAHYCYGCRCWYARVPTTCVEQHHRTELKPALKQYIKCEHCSYKTFIIGGRDAKGWKVFPRCPRCHEASFWIRGDAAPQVAGPVEAPHPF